MIILVTVSIIAVVVLFIYFRRGSALTTCAPGLYRVGYIPATSTQPETPGTCVPCRTPGPNQYVVTRCDVMSDTVIAPVPECPYGQNRVGYVPGTPTTPGAIGTCSPTVPSTTNTCMAGQYREVSSGICMMCATPGTGQYVVSPCSGTTNTVLATAPVCPYGQNRVGYVPGTPITRGTPGTCVPTTTTNTCTAGQYRSATGTCLTCMPPSATQYVITPCSGTTNTVLGTKQTCPSGQYLAGFSQGSVTTAGTPGMCTACTRPGPNQYVQGVCTGTMNTVLAMATTCPYGKTRSGYSAGTPTTLGRAGTCV